MELCNLQFGNGAEMGLSKFFFCSGSKIYDVLVESVSRVDIFTAPSCGDTLQF